MAIYNAVPPPPEYTNVNDAAAVTPPPPQAQQQQQQSAASAAPPPTTSTPVANGAIDIDAWTIAALESLSVSPLARGTATAGTAPLAIPIDAAAAGEERKSRAVAFAPGAEDDVPRRPPSRRDSMKKREALLKGKEGSRQRRRWENDRLVGVPNAQPPLPSDWEVRPTHPTHRVPYQLAQFWDAGARQRAEDRGARLAAARKEQQRSRGTATGLRRGEVPRDLRESAKRTPAVAAWVRSLEEPVRAFLRDRAAAAARVSGDDDREAGRSDSSGDDGEEGEEQIVFRGRRAAGAAGKWKTARREVERETVGEGVVFDSFGDGEAAAYKRWLTHSISDYYGLESRSVTLPDPSRKVVYVGFRKRDAGGSRQVPRPLWEICC